MSDNMANTEAGGTETPETGTTNTQVEKTFTQAEVNDIVAKRIHQVKGKFEGIDPDEYRTLKSLKEQLEDEQLIKKQDFDGVLKRHKEKADSEITKLRSELERIKIDGALISASSKAKAVSPDHVAQLLRNQLKLDESGNVQVLDATGRPRYTDNMEPWSVDQLVDDFLASNQYFRQAGPAGTASQGNTAETSSQSVDLNNLNMNLPADRALYKKLKASGRI